MKASYRFFSILTAVLLSGFGLFCTGHQDALAAVTSTKTITGTISGITKISLSLSYQTDAATGEEFEILFELDDSVKLVGRQKTKDFKEGDTILVTYEETVSQDEEGKKSTSRKVTEIKFLKAASVVAAEPDTTSDPALTSQ